MKTQNLEIKSFEEMVDKTNRAMQDLENRLQEIENEKKICSERLNRLNE